MFLPSRIRVWNVYSVTEALGGSGSHLTSLASLSLQDEQKCVETVELGSYEKCQDLRAVLKRKHRFILLRSPGNKVGVILKAAPLPSQDLPGKISGLAWGRRQSVGSIRWAETYTSVVPAVLDAGREHSAHSSLVCSARECITRTGSGLWCPEGQGWGPGSFDICCLGYFEDKRMVFQAL